MFTRGFSGYRSLLILVLSVLGLAVSVAAFGPPSGEKTPPPGRASKLRGEATFGPTTCPVLVAENRVYTLGTLQPTGIEFDVKHGKAHPALSADGRRYASSNEVRELARNAVTVFDVGTGKKVADIPGVESERQVDYIAFAGSRVVVAALGEKGARGLVDIREADTGKLVRSFPIDGSERERVCVSPDGRFLGLIAERELEVYNIATGEPVAKMAVPGIKRRADDANRGRALAGRGPRPPGETAMDRNDAFWFFNSVRGLQFSPDGNEIAAAFGRESTRLLCWDLRGEITVDESYPTGLSDAELLRWVPDGGGWLLNGRYLIERQSRHVVWIASSRFTSGGGRHFIDGNHLVFTDNSNEWRIVDVPWTDIRKSTAALFGKAPAALRPGQSVDVRLEFGNVLGDQVQIRKDIVGALTKKLAESGFGVDGNKSLAFVIKFSEKQGEAAKIIEKDRPFGLGYDTGRTAHTAQGSIFVELLHKDSNTSLWKKDLSEGSSWSFEGDINDQTVRQSMLKNLVARMNEFYLPYFIPAETGLVALPVWMREEKR